MRLSDETGIEWLGGIMRLDGGLWRSCVGLLEMERLSIESQKIKD